MTRLVGRRLQEADRGQVVDRNSIPKVGQGVLVVCPIRISDGADRRRRQGVRVRGRYIVLEGGVVIIVLAGALRHTAGSSSGREIAIKPTPGDALCIQQV